MDLYRCFLEIDGSAPIGWQSIRCPSDAAARRKAMRMLTERSDVQRIEVWRGADLAVCVNRNSLQLRPD